MISAILTAANIAKNVSWESRFNRCVSNPIRSALGQETSYQSIARGLVQGHNAAKYDMVLADLELMYEEIMADAKLH